MRSVPGWVLGVAGVGVVASAFFLGGRLAAADVTPASPMTMLAGDATSGLQLECEPGQRAVLRQSSLACVGASVPAARYVQTARRPAVVPRSTSVQGVSTAQAPVKTTRSTKKSVAIIAGSAAAGAVVGGVAKGKKGAVIGGIVGGAAATIWDQVRRRR
jgi:hypothetical protein